MAIYGAETGAFSGSKMFGLLESPKHARNSINSQPARLTASTFALTAQQALGNGSYPFDSGYTGDAMSIQDAASFFDYVYVTTAGSLGTPIPSTPPTSLELYEASMPLTGSFQYTASFLPGIFTWTLTFDFAQDNTATTFYVASTIGIGVCGIPYCPVQSASSRVNGGFGGDQTGPPNIINPSTHFLASYAAPNPASYPGQSGVTVASGVFDTRGMSELGPRAFFAPYCNIQMPSMIGGPYAPEFPLWIWGGTPQTSPYFTTQPSNASVIHPASATFTVAALGYPTVAFQWQVSTNSGSTWTNITAAGTPLYSGFTTATLTIGLTATSMNGYEYRCVATDTHSQNSNPATLTVT